MLRVQSISLSTSIRYRGVSRIDNLKNSATIAGTAPSPMPRINRQKAKVPANDRVGLWPAMAENTVPITTIINSTPYICNQSIHSLGFTLHVNNIIHYSYLFPPIFIGHVSKQ